MIFQIRRLKFHILIALIVFALLPVMPVSADSFNTYYKVAPNISQGATIFIGEEGLDITNALAAANAAGTPTNISAIGWWASPAYRHTERPDISYSVINRTTNFTVNQTEFDGYEGEWYLADADNNNYAKPGAERSLWYRPRRLISPSGIPSGLVVTVSPECRFCVVKDSSSRSVPTCIRFWRIHL